MQTHARQTVSGLTSTDGCVTVTAKRPPGKVHSKASCRAKISLKRHGPEPKSSAVKPLVVRRLEEAIETESRSFIKGDYVEAENLRGARAVSQTVVYQLRHSDQGTARDLRNRLTKVQIKELEENVFPILKDCARGEVCSVWMSDSLDIDLNLQLEREAPKCIAAQLLFLGEGSPLFLLTLYYQGRISAQAGSSEVHEKMRLYTIEMAKALKSSLISYCRCDFNLLRFKMDIETFSSEKLHAKFKDELKYSQRYYGGPERLTAAAYSQLEAAVTAAAGVSCIPSALLTDPQSKEMRLILLDSKWRDVLSLTIELLASAEGDCEVACTGTALFKLRVAMLEAARRLSFRHQVVLVSTDDCIADCIRNVKEQTKREQGRDLGLRLQKSAVEPFPEPAECMVCLDMPLVETQTEMQCQDTTPPYITTIEVRVPSGFTRHSYRFSGRPS